MRCASQSAPRRSRAPQRMPSRLTRFGSTKTWGFVSPRTRGSLDKRLGDIEADDIERQIHEVKRRAPFGTTDVEQPLPGLDLRPPGAKDPRILGLPKRHAMVSAVGLRLIVGIPIEMLLLLALRLDCAGAVV